MASTDALPLPQKGVAFRCPIGPIFDTSGNIVTGWTSADTEISMDAGSYADCTNEATEIGTSGTGYIDLTTGETNCDSIWLKTSVSNSNSVDFCFYSATNRAGVFKVDVQTIAEASAAVPGATGGLLIAGSNAATSFVSISGGSVVMDALTVIGAATFQDDFSIAQDLTISGTATIIGATTLTLAAGTITASSIADGAITATKIASGAIVSATFAAGTTIPKVTEAVSLTTNNDKTGYALSGTQTFSNTGTWTGNIVGTVSTVTTLTNLPSIPSNWITAAGIADAAIDTATFASGTTLPVVNLVNNLTTYTSNTPQTGDSYARIGATGSGLTSLAPSATALSTAVWTGTKAGFIDVALSTLATATNLATANASLVKVQAAVYDSAALSGSTITLSNAATLTVTTTGRVTA